jgi:2-polyprenyl-3-methyl-5-hydroxy-6-metoxy-1,4-benzoquinol methylase
MENGIDINVVKQFDKIALLPDKWDHNLHYQKYLLKQIPKNCNYILDVGCGTGELTKKLSLFAKEIIGIDISENMLQEARKRNFDDRINYLKASVEKYIEEADKQFDVIISIAALHHMDEEKILSMAKNKLVENGKILILDCVREETLFDYLVSLLAIIPNKIMLLIKNGTTKQSHEEKEAWAEHYKYDKYLTIKQVKNIVKNTLGKAKIKRHLFWRYSIIYTKK